MNAESYSSWASPSSDDISLPMSGDWNIPICISSAVGTIRNHLPLLLLQMSLEHSQRTWPLCKIEGANRISHMMQVDVMYGSRIVEGILHQYIATLSKNTHAKNSNTP